MYVCISILETTLPGTMYSVYTYINMCRVPRSFYKRVLDYSHFPTCALDRCSYTHGLVTHYLAPSSRISLPLLPLLSLSAQVICSFTYHESKHLIT